jgi:predicted esterase
MNNYESSIIKTSIHGSYLITNFNNTVPFPVIVGFHGYGETAEDQLQLLRQIPGIEKWSICSVQALHSFYNTRGKIGYSWMTSKERDLRIQENVHYINAVMIEITKKYSFNNTVVFHGFSQGTAVACRAALLGKFKPSGVILLGGDIPPEIDNLNQMQRILLARGKKDKFYSSVRWKKDITRVQNSDLDSFIYEFEGGHYGDENYFKEVGEFLKFYE